MDEGDRGGSLAEVPRGGEEQRSQKRYRPVLLDELLRRVQLLAELLHLLVVAETLLVVLVQLQALSDVAARRRAAV